MTAGVQCGRESIFVLLLTALMSLAWNCGQATAFLGASLPSTGSSRALDRRGSSSSSSGTASPCLICSCFTASPWSRGRSGASWSSSGRSSSTRVCAAAAGELEKCEYEVLLPFLSEHIQPSDQLLVVGASSDLAVRLASDGYGARDSRSFLWVIDSDADKIGALQALAQADPAAKKCVEDNKLRIEHVPDLKDFEVEQSFVDAVVDCGGLDGLLQGEGVEAAGSCIDLMHKAVRLGNPMIAVSKLPKETFCEPFESRFGWMQELDGDPGQVSAWYRGKINVSDKANTFSDFGLFFYVYTNVDNC